MFASHTIFNPARLLTVCLVHYVSYSTEKKLKQIVQIWYQFDVDGDVVTWPSPWYVTSSGRTNQEQFVRRTQRRRRCFFSARPYVLYPFLTQDTLKDIPKSYVSNIPIRTIIINHCPFLHPRLQGFLQSPLCFGLPQFHPMTWVVTCACSWHWAKVRSHGAFDQLRHQQSKSQFRGLRRFRRLVDGYHFAMPWGFVDLLWWRTARGCFLAFYWRMVDIESYCSRSGRWPPKCTGRFWRDEKCRCSAGATFCQGVFGMGLAFAVWFLFLLIEFLISEFESWKTDVGATSASYLVYFATMSSWQWKNQPWWP